jgi:hypothetical protein
MQQEQVDGRRNAAAAIGDDVLVRCDTLGRKSGLRVSRNCSPPAKIFLDAITAESIDENA